jgi:hypothetical protein
MRTINIDVSKPYSTTYYYEGHIKENGETYCFEIRDHGHEIDVMWLEEYDSWDKDELESNIIEQFKKDIWKE